MQADEAPQSLDGSTEPDRGPGKRPAARGTAFYPRKRANRACQVCRARKTKCDNRKPACSYCVKVGAICNQSATDLSSFDPASLRILDRLDELENLIKNERRTPGPAPPLNQSFASPDMRNGVPHPNQTSSQAASIDDLDNIPLRSILPEKVESLLAWSVFAEDGSQPSPIPDLGSPSPMFFDTPSNRSNDGLLDLETQFKALLDNFFFHVHCKNPIFDESATRRLVNNVMLDGIDWSSQSCLALLILALGRIARPLGPSLDTGPGTQGFVEARTLFNAAQKRIGAVLCQTDIIGAQCLFLSGVYMMCVFRPFQAWRFFSDALAACQILPFLQKAHKVSYSEAESSAEPEALGTCETQAQAIYWSSWKSEREMRADLVLPDFSMPHSTSVLYPPFFPTPPPASQSADTVDSERQRASWLFYLAEISLRRLSSRVCDEIMQLHRSSATSGAFLDDLAALTPLYESQAQQWAESLPPELSIAEPQGEDNICKYVLRGHFINFFETIYWPFVMAHLGSLEAELPSTSHCQSLATKGLHYHIRRIYMNEPGFLHRHHGTYPMIRGCIRSALVLVAAGLLGSDLPLGWHDATSNVIQLLESWGEEVPEFLRWKVFIRQSLFQVNTPIS
ncbi:hypothetical protein S40285_07120 [Stachybotrys chlorohalonatus IBT 40285]|uniref:Zn(2)-C6 fungal-type domain-containing protein n=1 Tax=Stachybotrys chlorohalonatus (strain IBT 40285) TaxID=1283841 RepID=A0A084QID7_STAC4|nr:hypothetical protein S40285_07120 [Stachybotrys chlorohalonata IBT 40285]